MLTVNCPNCGAEVIFRSPALPVKVCDYCHTSVMRVGDEIRNMGESAVLPFDVSPIQIGTAGKFFGTAFDVIGRVRWGWSDGSWNEWLVLFSDFSHGWLGEAMGQFMMTRQRAVADIQDPVMAAMLKGGAPSLGAEADVDGAYYRVSDIKQATCIAAEGELPFAAPTGLTITSVDMRSSDGKLASFQSDGEEPELYMGQYIELADLQPTNLRDIAGWKTPRFAA